MKKELSLSAIITLSVCGANSLPIFGQTNEAQCQTISQKDDEAKLLNIIQDKDLVEKEPQKVIDAIDKLGKMKSVKAINDLVKLLTLSRGKDYEDETKFISGGITSPYKIYPAAGALYDIGEPSAPALVKVIENEETDSLASKNALFILIVLYREQPEKAAELLRKQALITESFDGSERLQKAVRYVEDLIEKLKQPDN